MKFLASLFGSQTTEAKNLVESRAQLASAKASAEVVAALFTTAGLDLDAMIEAGPDSLKAHLASLSAKDGELAAAQAAKSQLETRLAAANTALGKANALLDSHEETFRTLGVGSDATPAAFKTAFDAHVKKEAALELAKSGHRPIADVITTTDAKGKAIDPTLTGAARTKAYFASKLTAGK